MARARPASAKEQEPQRVDLAKKEQEVSLREAQARADIEKELEGFVESADHEPEIPAELVNIGVHSPAQAASQVITGGPTIALPLSQNQITFWLKNKVWDSTRWLAEWARRIAKGAARHGVRIIFGDEKDTSH